MFERISFRHQTSTGADGPLDLGMLLECMLFYQSTNVIADHSILEQLLREIGIDEIAELADEQLLKVIYTESMTGIQTDT
jgi:hypothetical protein